YRRLDPRVLQRRYATECDIAVQLWQWREYPAHFARGSTPLDNHGKHLQRRDQAIASGSEVGKDDVARLFATNVQSRIAHLFRDVAIAHPGPPQLQTELRNTSFQSQVRHDGGDHGVADQAPADRPRRGDQCQYLVTIDELSVLVAK